MDKSWFSSGKEQNTVGALTHKDGEPGKHEPLDRHDLFRHSERLPGKIRRTSEGIGLMSRSTFVSTVIVGLVLAGTAQAGIQLVGEAKLAELKGQTVLGLAEFDYSEMVVGQKDRLSEEVYLRDNKKGDAKAAEGWQTAKKERYPEHFAKLMNKVLTKKTGVTVDPKAEAPKYTIQVKVLMIEPGHNVGVSRRPAVVDFEIKIVETAKVENVIASFTCMGAIGQTAFGYDFDQTSRISESFAKCGKDLANYLRKKAF